MTVSIIIPVYNVEKYIRQCLDSVLAQTFTDFEAILVDDCSPDSSGAICDEYAAKDERIKVIHHEQNGGVSRARQAGTDAAQGEYTIHVDPDDWVEPDMLEKLLAHARKTDADMVICDFWTYSKRLGNVYVPQNLEPNLTAESVLRKIVFQQLPCSCWNKLVRRACYSNNNIGFYPFDITYCEDELFNIRVLGQHNIYVSYLPKAFYHYRQNQQSLVNTPSIEKVRSKIIVISETENILSGPDYDDFYSLKRETIFMALITRLFDSYMTLFPEIHQRAIADGRPYRWYSPRACCVSLALRGWPRTAYHLFKINMWAVAQKECIQGVIRSITTK